MNHDPRNPNTKPRGGPKTPQGKRRSSMNALKHGRYARSLFVLRHEDHAAFEHLVDIIARAFLPQSEFEYHLIRQLAAIEWRLQRVLSLDSSLLDTEFAATDAAFSQHGLTPRPEVKLGAATHQLLESSRLPYYLATRESQLLYARSQILSTLRHVRKGGAPSLPCPNICQPMDLTPTEPAPAEPCPSTPSIPQDSPNPDPRPSGAAAPSPAPEISPIPAGSPAATVPQSPQIPPDSQNSDPRAPRAASTPPPASTLAPGISPAPISPQTAENTPVNPESSFQFEPRMDPAHGPPKTQNAALNPEFLLPEAA